MFTDRHDAGRQLATCRFPTLDDPVVVALPRGGVPVAYELARALHAPLDILAVRKLGAPGNPEYGIGAIAEDGASVLDERAAQAVGMTREMLEETVEREAHELHRRVRRYRGRRAPIDVHGREVVVVDDGLATGLSDLAAVRALRNRGAARIVVAAPVASADAILLLDREADEVICHTVPESLLSIGTWYGDFSPVSDDEVTGLLAQAAEELPAHAVQEHAPPPEGRTLMLPVDASGTMLAGDLVVPADPRGLVIFAHGSGSSRMSPRNRAVARTLNRARFATLLIDLLTESEARHRELVFDIDLLARRLERVTQWARQHDQTSELPIGFFGASTGAGAALRAAAALGDAVRAVVSRGGRPDLAGEKLPDVTAPTLLLVGGRDPDVLELNRQAAAQMRCVHHIEIVPGAGHLFEEPGTLEAVTELATDWLAEHLGAYAPPLTEKGD